GPLTDGQLGRPAERPHLTAVKEDERVIANPTALAAAVNPFRVQTKMFRNPVHRIVDLAGFVGSQIIDIDLFVRFLDHHQDRVDTVMNVKIGLALFAVAEDMQASGIVTQSLLEVEDVTVRITFASNRNEAEDSTFKAHAFTICL